MVFWTAILLLFAIVLYGEGSVSLQGTYLRDLDGEIVYQIPTATPKGVLFLAHGCSHSIIDWWPKSSTCEHCIGLPIEMTIVQEAVNNNYAVLALSSAHGTNKKCWIHNDVTRAKAVIKRFYDSKLKLSGASSIPLHLLGVAIGGSFVVALAQNEKLSPLSSSVCLIAGSANIMNHNDGHMPPLLFIVMAKDNVTSVRVQSILSQGHLHSKVFEAKEKPIHPEFFHVHSLRTISLADSTTLQQALVKSELIDNSLFLLREDPRYLDWRSVAVTAVPSVLKSPGSENMLTELLHMAYGHHEITAEYIQEMIKWFDEHNHIPSIN